MKKIIFLFILFVLCSLPVSATSWTFQWDELTTTIEIPLGASLQNYISIPKAFLFRNGVKVEDAEIHYISTGDWLYLLTDVNTNQVGNYQVWYKATEGKYQPGQCPGYKTLVTFKVVDFEKPVFKECPEHITHYINAPKPNYLEQIIATDNSGNCKITIDDSKVDYDLPGNYEVIVRANDGANISQRAIEVSVIDPVGPVITFLGENNRIVLTKGEPVLLQNYFKALDKIDGDVTDSMTYQPFSTDKEDSMDLEVTFYDKNKNASSIIVHIDILDKDEVKIELYQNLLILDYNQEIKEELLKNLKSANLGKEDIKEEVEIDTDEIKKQVGSYRVTYHFKRGNKEGNVSCEVKLLSSSAPVLMVENITLHPNEKVNFLDYIHAIDPSDEAIQSKIEFDDSYVDYTKAGTYSIRVTVTNSSNLSTVEHLYLTIVSNQDSLVGATNPFLLPALVGIGFICVGVVIFTIIRKKRNCNKNENIL